MNDGGLKIVVLAGDGRPGGRKTADRRELVGSRVCKNNRKEGGGITDAMANSVGRAGRRGPSEENSAPTPIQTRSKRVGGLHGGS